MYSAFFFTQNNCFKIYPHWKYQHLFFFMFSFILFCGYTTICFFIHLVISVQFSCSVVSDFLRPHEPQHARPPCPSPTPGAHPNPCPLNWWCHPTISSSVIPFSSCPPSFPASGSFPMSQVAKVLKIQLQHQSFQWTSRTDLLWDGLVGSPSSPRDSQESSPTPQFKSINSSSVKNTIGSLIGIALNP